MWEDQNLMKIINANLKYLIILKLLKSNQLIF